MKILLTGGGTGGHFYPLIAIAEKLVEIADKEKIVDLKLYYMSDRPYDKRMLFENKITFIQIPCGKMRTYFSISNFFDIFKTATGAVLGIISMFFIFPDVHESDSYPGRLNVWTAKFAWHVAISWPEAADYLPKDKTALTGQPIRKEILHVDSNGAYQFFKLKPDLPVILVIGGSLGAQKINDVVVDVLPELLSHYQIIHQTRSKLLMANNPNIERYVPIPYLNNLSTRMAAGCADIIISRAGSAIFEFASWGIPSIIIPITNSNGDHQRKNAFNYARSGACEVIEEANLTSHVLVSEIDKLLTSKERLTRMKDSALAFATPHAAEKIGQSAINLALSHEEQ